MQYETDTLMGLKPVDRSWHQNRGRIGIPVRTENLDPDVVVMESAKDRV